MACTQPPPIIGGSEPPPGTVALRRHQHGRWQWSDDLQRGL